jgi:hypothetical protein
LFAVIALLLPAGGVVAKKKGTRYGLEGRLVEYDEGRGVVVVKVVKTKVSGGAGTGRVAGRPAPKKIKRGADVEFAVVAEGSVLRRTIVKNRSGGGLDTTGTKEGFSKALEMVPRDKNVVFSFEKAKAPGGPEWDLRIIQLRMTEQEFEAREKARNEANQAREAERTKRLGQTAETTDE